MNTEHDLAHIRNPPRAPAQDDDLTPGRGSRSSQLAAPSHPIAGGLLLRKAWDANGVADDAEQSVAAASSSCGHTLSEPILRKFESSLGADLSSVRVHTGGESQAAAASVGARAYTVGQDIHFGAGEYDPSSSSGEHLLAHEVAHTVQQLSRAPSRQCKLEVSSPGDAAEVEADRAADAMVSGGLATVASANGIASKVARKIGDDSWWKLVLTTYASFLKAKKGDQAKALAELKVQLGGAYPGDDAVLARAGGGAPQPHEPPPEAAPADPGNDDNLSDAADPESEPNQSYSSDSDPSVAGPVGVSAGAAKAIEDSASPSAESPASPSAAGPVGVSAGAAKAIGDSASPSAAGAETPEARMWGELSHHISGPLEFSPWAIGRAQAPGIAIHSPLFSAIGSIIIDSRLDAAEYQIGFIQVLIVSWMDLLYVRDDGPDHTMHISIQKLPIRDSLDASSPWSGAAETRSLADACIVNFQDRPRNLAPWKSPDGKGNLTRGEGADVFSTWFAALHKPTGKFIFLSWGSWSVNWGCEFDSKAETGVSTGGGSVHGGGQGSGPFAPITGGEIANKSVVVDP